MLRRTARESWEDSVFGQCGRIAFYQFLALIPSLIVFLVLTSRVPHVANTVAELARQVFPDRVSDLLQTISNGLEQRSLSGMHLILACGGVVWSSFNSTWAMIYGLNRAYEVKERRSRKQMALKIAGLSCAIAAIGTAAIFLVAAGFYLDQSLHAGFLAARVWEWLLVAVAASFFLSVLYRFAPDLPDPEWRWSTPGAVCALIIWICSVFAARFYFQQVNDYSRIYGYVNGVAILLIWLYASNGAILIGGELNSEIEKAAGARSHRRRN